MLAELVNYARKKGLDVEAGFRPKDVKWLLLFKPDGTFVPDVAQLGTEKRGLPVPKCPHLQFSGDTPMRQFLVDTAEYLALFGDDADGKLRVKHAYAVELLAQAGGAVPELAVISASMQKKETIVKIRAALTRAKAKAADNVTVAISDSDGIRVFVQEATWHEWWRSFWPTLFPERVANGDANASRCLVTGNPCTPALTHPKVRGLGDVGGKIETAMVSFNLPAFCSYGLDQSANAPISSEAANAYVGALNELIETTGQPLAGMKVIHWYAGQDEQPVTIDPANDPLQQIEAIEGLFQSVPEGRSAKPKKSRRQPDAEADKRAADIEAQRRAREFLRSVRSGELSNLANYRYFAITLSGSSARVMVRDFITGQFGDLCAAVESWFDDLEIAHRDPRIGGLAPLPKFRAVLGATVRNLKDIAPPAAAKLWRCAVHCEPIPEPFAAQALNRAVMNFVKGETPIHARMGLLRAYLRRSRKGDQHMTPFLNDDHPHPAYHCGRLLAVLDDIQYAALGDVGAGIVQRYYAAASATPALVLGRLVRLANTGHLPKVDYDRRQRLEQRLASVWGKLRQDPPVTLSLSEQTLFAMGYYQQKASG